MASLIDDLEQQIKEKLGDGLQLEQTLRAMAKCIDLSQPRGPIAAGDLSTGPLTGHAITPVLKHRHRNQLWRDR